MTHITNNVQTGLFSSTNYGKQEYKPTKKVKTLNIEDSKARMIITQEVYDKIKYACRKISSVEWSGRLFYKILEGTIKQPSSLVIELKDIYLEDKGSAAYTDFEADSDIMDLFTNNPELEDCSYGLIHSHNNMGVFFSGTDMSELEDNYDKFNMYVSLIVNNDMEFCAKGAFTGKRKTSKEINTETITYIKANGEWLENKSSNKEIEDLEEELMLVFDFNIEHPEQEEISDIFFKERVEAVIKNKNNSKTFLYDPYGIHKSKQNAFGGYKEDLNNHIANARNFNDEVEDNDLIPDNLILKITNRMLSEDKDHTIYLSRTCNKLKYKLVNANIPEVINSMFSLLPHIILDEIKGYDDDIGFELIDNICHKINMYALVIDSEEFIESFQLAADAFLQELQDKEPN
jgi:hypothetical protein